MPRTSSLEFRQNTTFIHPQRALRCHSKRKSSEMLRNAGLDCCFSYALLMDTQSCPNCKSREVTAALTIDRFVYLRCSECATVWAIRDRRDSLKLPTSQHDRRNDRRVARESPVIHDNGRPTT